MEKNSWQVVVEALEAEGVQYVFGMPGSSRLLYDALYDSRSVTAIHAREQSSGVFMAIGHARATRRVAVCFGSTGPGFTNMVSGILEAQAASTPLVVLSASVSTAHEGLPAFQETDQLAIARPLTKWSYRIPSPERTPWAIRRAFQIARSGCPGPVYLEIPADLSVQSSSMPEYTPAFHPAPPRPDGNAIERLAGLLDRAERPVVVAGGGAVWAGAFDEVHRLADELKVPVLTTASGRGSIDERNPLSLGLTGLYFTRPGREVYFDADLLLIVGSRIEQFETGMWQYRPANATIAHIDINAEAIGRNWIPDIGIVADVRSGLTDLLSAASTPSALRMERAEKIAAAKNRYMAEIAEECDDVYPHVKSKVVLSAYQRVFGRDSILVNENGSQDLWSYYSPYFTVPTGGCVPPGAQTCMGAGVSGAVGVKLAHPEGQVVCVTGDGAFQMYMRELAAAAQYRLGITYLVLNNRALGWVRFQQNRSGGRYIATKFGVQADFAAVASASGCFGTSVHKPEDLEAALEQARTANEQGCPAVLDIAVDNELPQGFERYHEELRR